MSSFDIIIIGAGLAGLSTAYHLSKSCSAKILILEKEKKLGLHASGRNAGLLRQAVAVPSFIPLIQATLGALQNPPEDWPQPDIFHPSGSLLLGNFPAIQELQDRLPPGLTRHFRRGEFPEGIPESLLQRLQTASYEAMLHCPSDGVVDVEGLLRNYLAGAQTRGVQLRLGSKLEKMSREKNRWRLHAGAETLDASVLVNAAGAWAPLVASACGGSGEEMQPFRRHLAIASTIFPATDGWPFVWNVDHEVYFRPEKAGGLLLSPGDEEPQPPGESITDPRALDRLEKKLKDLFPGLAGVRAGELWSCLRTKTKSGDFFVDWDRSVPGFFWVSALGGHGMSASWGLGALAARRILQRLEQN